MAHEGTGPEQGRVEEAGVFERRFGDQWESIGGTEWDEIELGGDGIETGKVGKVSDWSGSEEFRKPFGRIWTERNYGI